MSDTPIKASAEYRTWLTDIKRQFRQTQLKAAVRVNSELLQFYWQLGCDIIEQQRHSQWGDGFLTQLSHDLMTDFPQVKGFSKRNLEHIRRWVRFWQAAAIAQQPVSQLPENDGDQPAEPQSGANLTASHDSSPHTAWPTLPITRIPWGHNLVIVSKCQSHEEALFYAQSTLTHGWSRNVLVHQIENGLWQRRGKTTNNFDKTLPKPQSDLAKQSLKDPYLFDFLSLGEDYDERKLEQSLVHHITHFLLELGSGFAYVGKQVPLVVGDKDFYLDLLFYHVTLHCYVVIELKTGDFIPEYAGKMNFYLTAVDKQLKQEQDAASIGLLLCKQKDRLVAEYALTDVHKPIGIAEYQLTQSLPDNLKSSLPSVEAIEAELSAEWGNDDE